MALPHLHGHIFIYPSLPYPYRMTTAKEPPSIPVQTIFPCVFNPPPPSITSPTHLFPHSISLHPPSGLLPELEPSNSLPYTFYKFLTPHSLHVALTTLLFLFTHSTTPHFTPFALFHYSHPPILSLHMLPQISHFHNTHPWLLCPTEVCRRIQLSLPSKRSASLPFPPALR